MRHQRKHVIISLINLVDMLIKIDLHWTDNWLLNLQSTICHFNSKSLSVLMRWIPINLGHRAVYYFPKKRYKIDRGGGGGGGGYISSKVYRRAAHKEVFFWTEIQRQIIILKIRSFLYRYQRQPFHFHRESTVDSFKSTHMTTRGTSLDK